MRERIKEMGIVPIMLETELSPQEKQDRNHGSRAAGEDLHATSRVWGEVERNVTTVIFLDFA